MRAARPNAAQAAVAHDIHLHKKRLRDRITPHDGLHEDPDIRQAELDAALVSIVRGVTFALVELPSLQVLAHAQRPSLEPSADDLLDEGWLEGVLGRYYFVRTITRAVEDDGVPVYSLQARMLLKKFEDPASSHNQY